MAPERSARRALGAPRSGYRIGALVALLAVACDGAPPADELPPAAATARAVEYVFHDDELMRHAYASQVWPAAKADVYDDTRYAHPERYAITVPPSVDGLRPMVEWEPMRAVVMGYPAGMAGYQNATATVAGIARWAAEVAEVWFIVDDTSATSVLSGKMQAAGLDPETLSSKVKFVYQPIDSIWFIDYGPLPVLDTATDTFAFADFRYYHQRPLDDGISTWLGRSLEAVGVAGPVPTYRMGVSTEGGTFQATTDGVCFTGDRQLFYMTCAEGACDSDLTFQPLAELQKHPLTLSLQAAWGAYLGCKDVVITHSITDDGTGHIDMYLKIVDDQTIVLGDYPEPWAEDTGQEVNAARMDANAAFLEAYVKPDGSSFTVARLVMPGHREASSGAIPFTYINSTFVNGMNLWPAFTYVEWEGSRAEAQATWEAVMPDWEHVWIDSAELSFWSGAIHCITRTVPAAAPGLWVGDGTCEADACVPPEGADGYDGACLPGSVVEPVCYGPAWQCACNDCDTTCEHFPTTTDPCMGIGATGCCEEDRLFYCDGGTLKSGSCGDLECGWDSTNDWYECGFTGSDPDEAHPRSCEEVQAGCQPDCAARVCGDDGCGGSCGECLPGQSCSGAGQCDGVCVDQCSEGVFGCAGNTSFVCVSSGGCTDTVETDCGEVGLFCYQGACVPPEELPPDDGCAAAGRDAGSAPLLAALAALAAWGLRRRRQRLSRHA